MRTLAIIAAAIAAVFIFVWNFVFFVVNQNQQALVLQFGQLNRVVTDPGLNVMIPFVQNVIYFERRILDLQAPTEEVTSSDQKRLVVSAFARYRIINPLLYFQATSNIAAQAEQRLQAILNSTVRVVLAGRRFEAVLSAQRAELMRTIRDQVNTEAANFGIEVVDVRIRRADLPAANSQAIFARMRTDRQREAAEIRAKGQQAAQEIRAEADKQATIIIAEATKTSAIARGEGDGERNRIYAEAFGRDPSFFEFYRTMQAYVEALGASDTAMVLAPDSPFFRFFSGGAGRPAAP